jgi:CheY-like chemotaxis protein
VGSVQVRASADTPADSSGEINIQIMVQDSGIGISLEKQSRLFEAFMQADSSTTRKYGGTGLGLNLSRSLAEAMGGTLSLVSSVEGKGSTFLVILKTRVVAKTQFKPVQFRSTEELTRPSTITVEDLSGMDILLVEDSIDNQILFERYLKRAGAKVDVASDGSEGFEKAQAKNYNAILMDVQMPVLDGYGATKKIRHHGIATPIIALTAHAMKDERENALRSGFNGYLIKPLDPRLLIEELLLHK